MRGPAGAAHFLFVSPMGEPFRVEHPDHAWFSGADTDGDGRLTRAEFDADALRFFGQLDRANDGEIDPDDVDAYETETLPEVRVAGGEGPRGGGPGGRSGGRGRGDGGPPGGGGAPRGGGGRGGGGGHGGGPGGPGGGDRAQANTPSRGQAQGAARYAYLDLPEPITPADRNFNRGIDRAEFLAAAAQRFALLDRNGDGVLTPAELPTVDTRLRGGGPRGGLPGRPPGEGGRPSQAEGDDTD